MDALLIVIWILIITAGTCLGRLIYRRFYEAVCRD